MRILNIGQYFRYKRRAFRYIFFVLNRHLHLRTYLSRCLFNSRFRKDGIVEIPRSSGYALLTREKLREFLPIDKVIKEARGLLENYVDNPLAKK
jgi:hypothetical protein